VTGKLKQRRKLGFFSGIKDNFLSFPGRDVPYLVRYFARWMCAILRKEPVQGIFQERWPVL